MKEAMFDGKLRKVEEHEIQSGFDFAAFLEHHFYWTHATFGTGKRTKGITEHIRKELLEIEDNPSDLEEWIDVLLLAFDGAGRTGASPEQIFDALILKHNKCKSRKYPFPESEDHPSEHKRSTIKQVINELHAKCSEKGAEYAHKSDDRYRNFNQGAALQNETPEQTLLGYVGKQVVSLFDAKHINTEMLTNVAFINEKAGDIALYMVLLVAMVRDRAEAESNLKCKISRNPEWLTKPQ